MFNFRIFAAIGGVVDLKNKLVELNFFKKGRIISLRNLCYQHVIMALSMYIFIKFPSCREPTLLV